jgi:hypothetical protein
MAEGYLGQFPVDVRETMFADFSNADWAMYFIERYGGIDGANHKDWVLDQVSRILKGTPVIVEEARWEGGLKEFRVRTGDPSQRYLAWVVEIKNGEDGPDTYDYEEGTPP